MTTEGLSWFRQEKALLLARGDEIYIILDLGARSRDTSFVERASES
jgi:hypothetical protein